MKIYEIIQTEARELKEFHCDRCKKKITVDDEFELQETISISFEGGYSSVFGDGVIVECDLCQQCLKELIGEFCFYS